MSNSQLTCSSRGRALIEKYVGLRLNAHQDMFGNMTIGYGHQGRDVTPGQSITQQQAEELLIKDLVPIANGVKAIVSTNLNQNQFDALVSLAHDQGIAALRGCSLVSLLNAGNFQAAADQFPTFSRMGSREVAGLLARRNAERQLFLTPV